MNLINRVIAGTLPAVPRTIVKRVAAPYVAGETMPEVIATVRTLNGLGLRATVDVLGEDVTVASEAAAAAQAYVAVLDSIAAEGLNANVSIKLSAFGLKLDRKLCTDNLVRVLDTAAKHDNFVRIDMEDSSCTDATLETFDLVRRQHAKVGVVLQAMLRRTAKDAAELAKTKANVRLCKGIYIEPARIAYTDPEAVRESYMASLEVLLEGGSYVGIATHDDVLVTAAEDLVAELCPGLGQGYEFQMLLGVRPALRDAIVAKGHPLRVYVPFGEHWYAYSVRRLRENPAIAGHVLKALLVGEARPQR